MGSKGEDGGRILHPGAVEAMPRGETVAAHRHAAAHGAGKNARHDAHSESRMGWGPSRFEGNHLPHMGCSGRHEEFVCDINSRASEPRRTAWCGLQPVSAAVRRGGDFPRDLTGRD